MDVRKGLGGGQRQEKAREALGKCDPLCRHRWEVDFHGEMQGLGGLGCVHLLDPCSEEQGSSLLPSSA